MKNILLIALLALAACNTSKTASNNTAEKKETAKENTIITYELTPCFGKCPVLIMTIDAQANMINYFGRMNTEKMGKYTKPYATDSINVLIQEFEKAKFFQMEDKYLSPEIGRAHV